jgi:ankyrin repeat protein
VTRRRRTRFAIALAWLGVLFATVAVRADEPTDVTALLIAARAFDHDAALALVGQGADVDAAEADGTTALHWAAAAGDDALVAALLEAGGDPDAANRYGFTPLHAAADGGFAEAVTALLRAGADARAVLPEGETVLMAAARSGDAAVIDALLAHGAEIEARDGWYGETALIFAAAQDHAEVVRVLVAHGANVDTRSAAMAYASRRLGQSILPLGEWTPVMYAARENSLAAGEALIEAGADLDAQDPDGATALVIAIINAHYEFAAMLIEAGADPNIVDTEAGMGPLYAAVDMHRLAVGHGRGTPPPVGTLTAVDVARALLAAGADPNAALKKAIMQRTHTIGDSALGAGVTPLLRAAKSGDIEMVRVLVAGGADPFATLPNGNHALMFAAGLGWRDGSPAAPSYDQGTEEEAVATIDYLLELGVDVKAAAQNGDTALHAASAGRKSEVIVAHLLERGADPLAENGRQQTPLSIAESPRGGSEAIAALVRAAAARASPVETAQ